MKVFSKAAAVLAVATSVQAQQLAAQTSEWECQSAELAKPIQYLKCGTTNGLPPCSDPSIVLGHGFYSLELSTGSYDALFTIPATDIGAMNACGINPLDNRAYCAAQVTSSTNTDSQIRLIRFGSSHANPAAADFEYIAILPVPSDDNNVGGAASQNPNTGIFSSLGNYYMVYPERDGGNFKSMLFTFQNVHLLTGFATADDAGMANFFGVSGELTGWTENIADTVVVQADFENIGVQEYGFIMISDASASSLHVFRSPLAPGGFRTWIRSTDNQSPFNGDAPNLWGAAWNFQNQIFFSHNGGEGVWQVQADAFNPDNDNQLIIITRAGSSAATNANDGLSCISSSVPFTVCSTGGVAGGPITDAQCTAQEFPYIYREVNADVACNVIPGQPCDISGEDFLRCCGLPDSTTTDTTTTTEEPEFKGDIDTTLPPIYYGKKGKKGGSGKKGGKSGKKGGKSKKGKKGGGKKGGGKKGGGSYYVPDQNTYYREEGKMSYSESSPSQSPVSYAVVAGVAAVGGIAFAVVRRRNMAMAQTLPVVQPQALEALDFDINERTPLV